jgi:hypothetical protein
MTQLGIDLSVPRASAVSFLNSLYVELIIESLYMRRRAESAASGIDFYYRENQRQHQRLLDLARKADEIADYYKWVAAYSGIAMFFYRFFKPVAELEELHRREAELFRQRAKRPKGIIKVAREIGVGTGTMQRIKDEMHRPFVAAARGNIADRPWLRIGRTAHGEGHFGSAYFT